MAEVGGDIAQENVTTCGEIELQLWAGAVLDVFNLIDWASLVSSNFSGFSSGTNYRDGTVTRINIKANKVVGDPIKVGALPSAIAAGPSGVWVANSGDNTIQRID